MLVSAVSKEIGISEIKDEDVKEKNIANIVDNQEVFVEENIQNQDLISENITNLEEKEEIIYPLQTKVIQANNLAENYNTVYNDVKIKNETNFNLSQNILNPDVSFSSKDIIIFHTHTCESYTRNTRKFLCVIWKL